MSEKDNYMRILMDATTRQRLKFDAVKYVQFLQEVGIAQEQRDQLTVCFRKSPIPSLVKHLAPGAKQNGIFATDAKTIYVWTYLESPLQQLNNTLRHETGHFWQLCKSLYDFKPIDRSIPWAKRPHEIQACAFATCYSHWSFLADAEVVEQKTVETSIGAQPEMPAAAEKILTVCAYSYAFLSVLAKGDIREIVSC